MLKAPIPPNEAERLAALHSLNTLDTPREECFDRITQAAAKLHLPIYTISFIDSDREWYKSCVGLNSSEGGRDVSLRGHTITPGIVVCSSWLVCYSVRQQ